jgi:Methyltransferase domain
VNRVSLNNLRHVGGIARHVGGMVMAPAFRVAAFRDYAMRRATALTVQSDYPILEGKHLDNPMLFADREEMIQSMQFEKVNIIAEVGVARGDFSECLLNVLQPRKFVAIDRFTLHETPVARWGGEVPLHTYFNGMTHIDYYKSRFADRGDQMIIEVGESHVCLGKYPNKTFDLIYIDADHSYQAVRKDAAVAQAKAADGGIIIFNDYTMFDTLVGEHYGVVQAVNELVVVDDWRVCAFAFEKHMFCDIAIRKQAGSRLRSQRIPPITGFARGQDGGISP